MSSRTPSNSSPIRAYVSLCGELLGCVAAVGLVAFLLRVVGGGP